MAVDLYYIDGFELDLDFENILRLDPLVSLAFYFVYFLFIILVLMILYLLPSQLGIFPPWQILVASPGLPSASESFPQPCEFPQWSVTV